jgi:F-type H+-transporting ATPase subunit delta
VVGGNGIVSGIAGRYASALFDLARDRRALDDVARDLASVEAMIAESADLARLVRSPVISREDQGRAMLAILAAAGIGDLVTRFVGLVARNRRLFTLVNMIDAYRRLYADHRGEISADVTSARPLSDDQVGRIRQQLASAAGREVSVSTSVDPALLGGLVVRLGSRMIDSSLRTKIQNLQLSMKEVG